MSEYDVRECFYKGLEFGMGGIRAIMAPRQNRLNIHTIRKNTEGYARYSETKRGKSVVIAYDNRNHSKEFAAKGCW